ncbi:MAG: hypothetical protein E7580_08360 [Ruminococcaceae bacterium]|nr:hypothetical protein [Oscillospiraceae bacterium]
MTLEEYIGRFRLLQHSAEKAQRRLELYSTGAYQGFLRRFEGCRHPELSSVLFSTESLKRDLEKKQRLCERYAIRLSRAISLMEAGELRDYALYHYLYGLTHEQIAEQSFFCVRTIYRYARYARAALVEAMLQIKPKAVRTESHRYRVRGRLRRKKTDLDRIARAVVACTALRRRDSYNSQSVFA